MSQREGRGLASLQTWKGQAEKRWTRQRALEVRDEHAGHSVCERRTAWALGFQEEVKLWAVTTGHLLGPESEDHCSRGSPGTTHDHVAWVADLHRDCRRWSREGAEWGCVGEGWEPGRMSLCCGSQRGGEGVPREKWRRVVTSPQLWLQERELVLPLLRLLAHSGER